MKITNNALTLFISYVVGLSFGLAIPVCFALIDLHELGMIFNITNLIEVIKSQRIYSFALISFPLVFSFLLLFIAQSLISNKKLHNSRNFTKNILNSMQDYIFTVSKSYNLTAQNKLGQSSIEQLQELLYSHDDYIDIINSKRNHFEIELNTKTYLVSFSSSSISSQKYLGIMSLKDITIIKENQKELDRRGKELEVSSRLTALGEIAAGVAHEINNPLAIIQGNISLILAKFKKNKDISLEQIEICEDKVSDNIERISNIIRNLRNLATTKKTSSSTTVKDLLEKSSPLITNIVTSHAIELTQDIQVPLETIVNLNAVDFTQIIFNLINNSKDAMADYKGERWIKLEIKTNHDEILFSIIDSGTGIPKEIISNIFTPLYTTKDFGQGPGLGLSLSGMLAKKNNAILIYDKSAQHTTFILKAKIEVDISGRFLKKNSA